MKLTKTLRYTPAREKEFHELRMTSSSGFSTLGESILHDMSALDGKSSALLTFISVVLVTLIFALSAIDGKTLLDEIIRFGFYASMATFAIAGAINIRCVYSLGRDDFPENATAIDYEMVILQEITIRRQRYTLALQIVRTGGSLLALFLLAWFVLNYFIIRGS